MYIIQSFVLVKLSGSLLLDEIRNFHRDWGGKKKKEPIVLLNWNKYLG